MSRCWSPSISSTGVLQRSACFANIGATRVWNSPGLCSRYVFLSKNSFAAWRTNISLCTFGPKKNTHSSRLQKVSDILIRLSTHATFFAFCLAFLAVGFCLIYLPMLKTYHNGCVLSYRGTLLSRNIFSMSMNLAVSDGKRESLSASNDYRRKVRHDKL